MAKILFLLQTPPPTHGSSIIGETIKKSYLINSSFECNYINMMTSRNLGEIGKNPIKKLFRYTKIMYKLLIKLILFRPDIVYFAINAKGIAFYKDFFLTIIIKLFGIKPLLHFHNKGVSESSKFLDIVYYKFLFKNSKVILLSPRLFEDVRDYVNENNVFYCPNGIVPPKYQIQKRKKNKIVKLLFLSNLFYTKGIFVLLEALNKVKKQNFNFHCDIVGGEGDISFKLIKKTINGLGLNKFVTIHGEKYGCEKFNFFETSDIFVFPSYYETFGLVNLEAMHFGLPIISTNEGGIPDIVDHGFTGFIVDKKNSEDLAKKIKILIDDPIKRMDFGKAGKIKFQKNYTKEIFEKNIYKILNKL